jgi:antitoxin (DNA-binding transcriptional repressor) of toxin-antitoxin stability system
MKYTVHQAKTNLSRLLEEACSGKEVVIARGRQPVAKLVALGSVAKKRVPGRLAGQISYTSDAFDPLTEQELSDLGFEPRGLKG